MGCVSSKRNINNLHPNIYEVVNVDDDGNKISVGHLEVTETELILRQKHKAPTVWPLKSLRRYGADSELFSFESGRRAPTGEGIYAFQCQRAEQLFNHLQAQFTAEENAATNVTAQTPDSSEPSGYLEPSQPRSVVIRQRQWNSNGRMDSIHSTGPVSPPPVSPPPSCDVAASSAPATPACEVTPSSGESVAPASDVAERRRSSSCDDSNNNQHPYLNYEIIEVVQLSSSKAENADVPHPGISGAPAYMNVEIGQSTELSSSHSSDAPSASKSGFTETQDSAEEEMRDHLYMNIVPGYDAIAIPAEERVPPEGVAIIAKPVSGVALPFVPRASQSLTCAPLMRGKAMSKLLIGQDSEEDSHPCYTNLSPTEREGLATTPPLSLPTVNYAVLDLNQPPASPASSLTPTGMNPDSPLGSASRGYATIDFNRTEALSHSVNPTLMDEDSEGCRKTRHNSTISDLPTPVD